MPPTPEWVKRWREENPERYQEHRKRYRKSAKRKAAAKRYRQGEAGKAAAKRAVATYRKRNPEKMRAHARVYRALQSGKLVRQPCESCGVEPAQAHHDDYAKPLDVRWLCRKCHVAFHN